MWLFHYFLFMFSFFSHVVSAIVVQLCLVLFLRPFYMCLSYMEDSMGLLGLPHFYPFLGPRGCLLLLSAKLACWAFLLSPLLLGSFQPLFYVVTYYSYCWVKIT